LTTIGFFLFNAVIDSLDLRDVSMIEIQFTWANSIPEPTYEKLDRVIPSYICTSSTLDFRSVGSYSHSINHWNTNASA
jgi:hypothetical protein